MAHSILIVDDEALTLRTMGRALQAEGYEVLSAASGEEGLQMVADEKPDLALLDVVLPGINGIEVLRQAKKISPAMIVVMMSAYHMVDRAVEAMKLGAYDYLIKPFHLADMVNTIQRAEEMLALRVRVRDTVESAKGRYDFGRVVTQSPAMCEVLEMARRDPLQQPAGAGADDRVELCGAAGHAAGERAVWLRARRVHRCAAAKGRIDREGFDGDFISR